MNDLINHPDHYTQGIECWDYITSHKMGYLEGNVIKYVTRYKDKDGMKDLLKAQAYLTRLINQEEEKSWPSEEECAKPIDLGWAPPGTEYGRHPCAGVLEDVLRLNGAIPLPPWELDGDKECGLDGRNCRPCCGCDHPERGICAGHPAIPPWKYAPDWSRTRYTRRADGD